MIELMALLLAVEEPVTTVDSELFDWSDPVGLEWDCQRERGNDKLILGQIARGEGMVPHFVRTLDREKPEVVVDCSAEVYAFGKDSLSMSSGFCPNEWGIKIKLVDGNDNQAIADLRLGQEWINGYQCVRRTSGERA